MAGEPTGDGDEDEASSGGVVGKVQEKLGWLTADRREEAKGKLRQAGEDGAEAEADEADEVVNEAERDVRRDYGELKPEADPEHG